MASGVTVLVITRDWGMSVYVTVPEDDNGKTSGLCGNNNGNAEDDMTGPTGQTFTEEQKRQFVDSWR